MCYPHEAMPENRTDYDEVIWVVRLVCSGKLKACANTNQTHAHTTLCSHVGCQSRFVDQWRQERLKNERTLLSRHIKKETRKGDTSQMPAFPGPNKGATRSPSLTTLHVLPTRY